MRIIVHIMIIAIALFYLSNINLAQNKKPTLTNEDIGSSTQDSKSYGYIDPKYINLRQIIFKTSPAEPITPEIMQTKLVNYLLNEQKKGNDCEYCFCNNLVVTKLFAPRSWEIVDKFIHDDLARFTVRIESSNRGGLPVVLLWDVYTKRTKGNDFCIGIFTQKDE